MRSGWPAFIVVLLAQLWAAHAVAFFAHEYGHSFVAWALGWKARPLVLEFGDLSWPNLLVMSKIDEGVDYGPIFAAGHGGEAALIAAAGVLANAALYPVAILGFERARRTAPAWAMACFWLAVMCVGNFIDYVPTRCFSPGADMHTLERGLGVAPMLVVLGLGLPFLIAGAYLLARLLPRARTALAPGSPGRQGVIVAVTTFLIFGFFTSAGFESGVGAVARDIALTCIFVAFPVATVLCWPRKGSNLPKLVTGDTVPARNT
jgi:hypothetical protein